jgi:hypothetical protein
VNESRGTSALRTATTWRHTTRAQQTVTDGQKQLNKQTNVQMAQMMDGQDKRWTEKGSNQESSAPKQNVAGIRLKMMCAQAEQ